MVNIIKINVTLLNENSSRTIIVNQKNEAYFCACSYALIYA